MPDAGRNVEVIWPKKAGAVSRVDLSVRSLIDHGRLDATIRVPDAAAPLELSADLRARLFTTSVELAAPREGRAKTRINWIVRQLKDAPDNLRIEVRYPNAKETVSSTLKEAREKPDRLLFASDPHREPRAFRLLLARDLGSKRGKLAGSFVAESKRQTIDFYRSIVQGLKPWSPSAPQLPGKGEQASLVASPQPPEFTDEGREFGEASLPQ